MNLLSTLREFWVRLAGGSKETPVSPEYSYRIFWVKQALDWDLQKRARVQAEVQTIISEDRFVANNYKRHYKLEGFRGQEHSGASLLVLNDVLENLDRIEKTGGL
jgi:hypothetical protein